MSEENKNDFWNSDEKDSFWNNSDQEEFWKTDYSGLSEEFFDKKSDRENPYLNKPKKTKAAANPYEVREALSEKASDDYVNEPHNHKDSDWVMKEHKREIPIEPGEKRFHIHTLICLFIIGITAVFCVICFLAYQERKKESLQITASKEFEETAFTRAIEYNANNLVYVEDKFYTVASKGTLPDFPEGMKLVAAYFSVKSDTFTPGSYALTGPVYIGFDLDGKTRYKKTAREDVVMPYLAEYGFEPENLMDSYCIGNGSDQSGFYFFFVPEEVEQVRLFVEIDKTVKNLSVVDRIYYRDTAILPEDKAATAKLTERKGQADESD